MVGWWVVVCVCVGGGGGGGGGLFVDGIILIITIMGAVGNGVPKSGAPATRGEHTHTRL